MLATPRRGSDVDNQWRPVETTVMKGARRDSLTVNDVRILEGQMEARRAARLALPRFEEDYDGSLEIPTPPEGYDVFEALSGGKDLNLQ
jgi:hypothetical protein